MYRMSFNSGDKCHLFGGIMPQPRAFRNTWRGQALRGAAAFYNMTGDVEIDDDH